VALRTGDGGNGAIAGSTSEVRRDHMECEAPTSAAAAPRHTMRLMTSDQRSPVLVSACLLGIDCTYKATNEDDPRLRKALGEWPVIAVCPELEGGLGAPRPRAECERGDGAAVLDGTASVRTADGSDVTEAYVGGARAALALARARGATLAVLKERSPSCGCDGIYDGTHSRTLRPGGVGVTAALLRREGVEVVGETEAVRRLAGG